MNTGKILIYISPAGKKTVFIYDYESEGRFMVSVRYSSSKYLESGVFPENMYNRAACREALPEEEMDYKIVIQTSKYRNNLLQTLKERSIEI